MNTELRVLAVAGLLAGLTAATTAAEFRTIRPILSPAAIAGVALGPVEQPVSRDTASAAARRVMQAWNTPDMQAALADGFVDRQRLLDAMSDKVPLDARLRVLGVQGMETLGQTIDGERRVSTVSVTVRAQVEYEDVQAGLVRREGTSELLLRISEPVRP